MGLTVTVNVTGSAQPPAVGVNVYTPEALLLITAGLQLPLTPLLDTEGRVGTAPPAQMVRALPNEKVGVVFAVTVTVKAVLLAHWPAAGVKV